MRYFAFFFHIKSSKSSVHFILPSTSQFVLASFQVLNSTMHAVATIIDRASKGIKEGSRQN